MTEFDTDFNTGIVHELPIPALPRQEIGLKDARWAAITYLDYLALPNRQIYHEERYRQPGVRYFFFEFLPRKGEGVKVLAEGRYSATQIMDPTEPDYDEKIQRIGIEIRKYDVGDKENKYAEFRIPMVTNRGTKVTIARSGFVSPSPFRAAVQFSSKKTSITISLQSFNNELKVQTPAKHKTISGKAEGDILSWFDFGVQSAAAMIAYGLSQAKDSSY